MKKICAGILIWTLLMPLLASAEVKVKAALQKNNLLIGEQTQLYLSAEIQKGEKIVFPQLKDTITKGLEIMKAGKIDTLPNKGGQTLALQQNITITSFDTGYNAIPPFTFTDTKGKNYQTEALLIGIHTVSVDTTRIFKDIKGVKSAPIPWWEYAWYLLIPLAAGIAYLLYNYLKRKHKKTVATVEEPEPIIDPFAHALQELENLKKESLWQNGFYKEYHTRLSEIVKVFISGYFNLHVLELTSDETLKIFTTIESRQEPIRQLRQVLMLSDMVKFAKQVPVGSENDLSMQYAISFVNFYNKTEKKENELAAG